MWWAACAATSPRTRSAGCWAALDELETGMRELTRTMLDDYTVQERTRGIGYLSKEDARLLGAAGPTLRGSGWEIDERMHGYAAYKDLNFIPVVEPDGDCYARAKVRFYEVLHAIELVREALNRLPESELTVKVPGNPEGESVFRVEQPRGELFYYIRANGTKNLERMRVRTPTLPTSPPCCTCCRAANCPTCR